MLDLARIRFQALFRRSVSVAKHSVFFVYDFCIFSVSRFGAYVPYAATLAWCFDSGQGLPWVLKTGPDRAFLVCRPVRFPVPAKLCFPETQGRCPLVGHFLSLDSMRVFATTHPIVSPGSPGVSSVVLKKLCPVRADGPCGRLGRVAALAAESHNPVPQHLDFAGHPDAE